MAVSKEHLHAFDQRDRDRERGEPRTIDAAIVLHADTPSNGAVHNVRGAGCAPWPPPRPGASVRRVLARHRSVLRTPFVGRVMVTGVLARLPGGMCLLAILLLLREHSGSFVVPGLAVGAYGAASAVTAPLQGRLVDRFGRTRAVEILRGGRSKVIAEHAYDRLAAYGAFAHLHSTEVLGRVDRLLDDGRLHSTGGRFPKLRAA